MLEAVSAMRPRYFSNFLWLLLLYALIILALLGTGEEKFVQLHLVMDTTNAVLSLLLAVFLLGEQYAIRPNVRSYLVIGFGLAAATELSHALIGIEWIGWFSWIQSNSEILRPATWPPSTYLLPLALAWTFWLMRRNSALRPAVFAAGIMLLTVGLFALSFMLPRYVDTGILGIQRPTQAPLLLLWLGVIAAYWHERRAHPLYEGLALMGVLLFLSDLCMLYSTSPHEKFTMMAHAGKTIAYILLHMIQMRIAAEDSRGRSTAEAALRQSENHLRTIFETEPECVKVIDRNGQLMEMNAAGLAILEADSVEEVRQHKLINFILPEYRAHFAALHKRVMSGESGVLEFEVTGLRGTRRWLDTHAAPMRDATGKVVMLLGITRDITERKKTEEQIYNLAFYDLLTGLPNRRLLNDRLSQTLATSKRSGRYGALMFIDLDNFKPLNDTYGHGVGDLLLIEVARRITSCVREVDSVARFGGDEFVVMLGELDVDKTGSVAQTGMVAEKIRITLAEPYLLKIQQEGKEGTTIGYHCSASIGVVVFNGETSQDDIIRWADMAMYQAKDAGRNLIRFFAAQH
jgi:diguanylate cyclase (GGDEF)-like protein/PAS domain S-box-containing protein